MAVPPYYSVTQLTTYARCPRQYHYRYVLGRKTPPGIALVNGSAYHRALERGNVLLRDTREPKAAELTEWHEQALLDLTQREEVECTRQQWDRARDESRVVFPQYVDDVQKFLRPELVEHRFESEIMGRKLVGIIDLTSGGRCWDYKTTSRAKGPDVVRQSVQLATYARELDTREVGHIQFVVGGRRPRVEVTPVRLRKEDMEKTRRWVETTIRAIDESMRSGVWPRCMPDTWMCSRRFCGFYDGCIFGRQS